MDKNQCWQNVLEICIFKVETSLASWPCLQSPHMLDPLQSSGKLPVLFPLFKKDDHTSLVNYHPVSLTSCITKLMKSCVIGIPGTSGAPTALFDPHNLNLSLIPETVANSNFLRTSIELLMATHRWMLSIYLC